MDQIPCSLDKLIANKQTLLAADCSMQRGKLDFRSLYDKSSGIEAVVLFTSPKSPCNGPNSPSLPHFPASRLQSASLGFCALHFLRRNHCQIIVSAHHPRVSSWRTPLPLLCCISSGARPRIADEWTPCLDDLCLTCLVSLPHAQLGISISSLLIPIKLAGETALHSIS